MQPHVHFFIQLNRRNFMKHSRMQKREFRRLEVCDNYYHRCARNSKCSTEIWPRRMNLSKSRYSWASLSKSRSCI
jgi:hypothetical protein